jgi:hypothetical protein
VRSWLTKGFRYWFLQSNYQSTIYPCSSVVLTRQHAVTYSVLNLAVSSLNCISWLESEQGSYCVKHCVCFPVQSPSFFLIYLFIISFLYLWLFNDASGSSDVSYGFDCVVTAVALAPPLYEHGTIKKTAWKATLKYTSIYCSSIAQIMEIALTSVPLHGSIIAPRGIVG